MAINSRDRESVRLLRVRKSAIRVNRVGKSYKACKSRWNADARIHRVFEGGKETADSSSPLLVSPSILPSARSCRLCRCGRRSRASSPSRRSTSDSRCASGFPSREAARECARFSRAITGEESTRGRRTKIPSETRGYLRASPPYLSGICP